MSHSAAAVAALRAASHTVITFLMGKEITVLVADTANQASLKAYSSKVSGWTAPYLHTKLHPLNVMAVVIIIITTHINKDTNGLLFSR